MRRTWRLLTVASVALCAAACGTRAPGEARQSPSPGAAGDHAASPTAGHAVATTGSPLSGSFLMDLTWVSDQRGWALAAAPCDRGLCRRLAATANGGRTWTALPALPHCARVACVSQVRFATATVGYLFGPALFQTSDGGRSWHRVPGRPVESLEPSAGTVLRVGYDRTGCPGPCDYAVQETNAGSATWRTVLHIPENTAMGSVGAQVVRQGTTVSYLLLYGHMAGGAGTAHTMIFRSTDGGATWQRRPDPCGGRGRGEHDAIGLTAAPGGIAAALCAPRTGSGTTFVRTSTDNGSSWDPPRPVPAGTAHCLDMIAAASAAHLVLATGGTTGNGPFTSRLVASGDDGRHWSAAVTGTAQLDPQAPGAAFLGFEDARVGRWIGGPHGIWTTHDAGRHWREQAFP